MGSHNSSLTSQFYAISQETRPRFFRQPQVLDSLRTSYNADVLELYQGFGHFEPYKSIVEKSLRNLINGCKDKTNPSKDKKDRSGDPLWFHGKHVGEYAFCVARALGFDPKQATTVMISGHNHDYLEHGLKKGHNVFAERLQRLQEMFNLHDPDVTNLVKTMTKIPEDLPYLTHVGRIGEPDTFTTQSTDKARLAAWVLKWVDAKHNSHQDRTTYLDQWVAKEEFLRSNGQESEANEMMEKITRQNIRQLQYKIVIDYMAAKIDNLIAPDTTVPKFLTTSFGQHFITSKYIHAIKDGLSENEFEPIRNFYDTLNPKKPFGGHNQGRRANDNSTGGHTVAAAA